MLTLRDCVTGETVAISRESAIDSGRYALIKESCLGIHGRWPAGTILLDDGRGKIEIDGVSVGLTRDKLNIDMQADRDIAIQALEEINAIADLEDTASLPSAVIPPQIAHRFEPSQLEKALQEVMQSGHLHSIAKSPRISMRYDEELLPVSRVKRTASNFQRHLAAHSECWQQRTFTGVVPRKLQAKISEDELHIYENRVYARLLDHLERYVKKILAELRALNKVLEKGLKLDGSDSLHRSLRHALCDSWGESFAQGEAESLKCRSESKLEQFNELLRKIQQLKQSETYRAIPTEAQVPLTLKSTNILLNDPHYVKVRHLWNIWIKETASSTKDPVQIFQQRQRQQAAYQRYIGMVVLRAHQKIGWDTVPLSGDCWLLNHPSGMSGKLNLAGDCWQLSCASFDCSEPLTFVPLTDSFPVEQERPNRFMCRLFVDSDKDALFSCSPVNLFTEERVIEAVQRWWIKVVVPDYGALVSQLPKVTKENWPKSQPSGQFKLASKLSNDEFQHWLSAFTLSPAVRAALEKRYSAAKFVAYCPCCGRIADGSNFVSREGRGFKSSCNLCAADWELRSTGFGWNFGIGFDTARQLSAGRWHQIIELEIDEKQVA
ncbi:TPA: hypothetical protein QDZ95_003031 [Shewanella algae]|uniref:hypothetical protein n=1 Tax=Shewanella algae TaxID=38313 RepID=UPI001C5A4357|nr:hypothetical protein [Shewanella algae]HDS1199507.1 hypothetical protein [Shewanella algae]